MARQAEALGFDHVTANDDIVVPNRIASRSPYTATGEWPGALAGLEWRRYDSPAAGTPSLRTPDDGRVAAANVGSGLDDTSRGTRWSKRHA